MPENVGTQIPEAAIQRFRSLLSLPADKLRKLNQWLNAHTDIFIGSGPDPSELNTAAQELGISVNDLANGLSLVGTLLFISAVPGTIDHKDLQDLGLSDVSDNAKIVLEGLKIPVAQAEYARQRGLVLNSVLPTLEDVSAVCDLRAIFARSVTKSFDSSEDVEELLGYEAVVLVNLSLNDVVGIDSTSSFQLSDTSLNRLIKTLQTAAAQLKVLKNSKMSGFIKEDISGAK